jgi:DNA-binding NarL/FixJ family response regulator
MMTSEAPREASHVREIIVADDHPPIRAALRAALQQVVTNARIREACTVDGVIRELSTSPQAVLLVLLDLNMPDSAGFAGLGLLRASFPEVPVAILSAQEEPQTIRKAMELGARGYLPKTLELAAMAEAVDRMLAGETWLPQRFIAQPIGDADREIAARLAELTPQQWRVLTKIAQGTDNLNIAFEMEIAEQTVKAHVSVILKKLKVTNRTQAALLVQRFGPP